MSPQACGGSYVATGRRGKRAMRCLRCELHSTKAAARASGWRCPRPLPPWLRPPPATRGEDGAAIA